MAFCDDQANATVVLLSTVAVELPFAVNESVGAVGAAGVVATTGAAATVGETTENVAACAVDVWHVDDEPPLPPNRFDIALPSDQPVAAGWHVVVAEGLLTVIRTVCEAIPFPRQLMVSASELLMFDTSTLPLVPEITSLNPVAPLPPQYVALDAFCVAQVSVAEPPLLTIDLSDAIEMVSVGPIVVLTAELVPFHPLLELEDEPELLLDDDPLLVDPVEGCVVLDELLVDVAGGVVVPTVTGTQ